MKPNHSVILDINECAPPSPLSPHPWAAILYVPTVNNAPVATATPVFKERERRELRLKPGLITPLHMGATWSLSREQEASPTTTTVPV